MRPDLTSHAAFGWCEKCDAEHHLGEGNARLHAEQLMQELEKTGTIDYRNSPSAAKPELSTDYLFGPARGQMFGMLECEDSHGKTVVLRAFSCQYNATWEVEGWVPPLFDVADYNRIMTPGDKAIKELGKRIANLPSDADELQVLKSERKAISRSIMKSLHNLYQLHNFCGETAPLDRFFKHVNGPPTGAGDCCAPKLLNYAALNNLRPLGIAEFYWGKTNRSETCEHRHFYASCASKCQPILGFMLCGIK